MSKDIKEEILDTHIGLFSAGRPSASVKAGILSAMEEYASILVSEATEPLKAEIQRRKGEDWISVEDRLPEIEGRYIILKKYGQGRQEVGISFFRKDHNCFDDFLEKIITHWRKLPEPPKQTP